MNKEYKICTLCLTNTKNYKVVNENTVCDSCYNELFRLSKQLITTSIVTGKQIGRAHV